MAFNVMRYSVESNATKPISVNGLFIDQLPISRVGATEFTYSRFLVPWLMDYEGFGLFCDEDQVMTGDVWELFSYCSKHIDEPWDIAVVKDQPQFEWPSVMVFNNQNLRHLTPDFVEDAENRMFDLAWAKNIAELPAEWNHFCGEMEPKNAKLYHFSQGIPYWKETRGLEEDHIWFEAFEKMMKSDDWIKFHAGTKHFMPVMQRFLKQNYGLKINVQ